MIKLVLFLHVQSSDVLIPSLKFSLVSYHFHHLRDVLMIFKLDANIQIPGQGLGLYYKTSNLMISLKNTCMGIYSP